ncbi:Rieske 2Fe-2S domain-containing protein [Kiritimatiellota bacterium B12222]|nr:Rieske 2Fe-2S domain-containing protein [Kiritimatiellota bacterium B12222]
MSWTPVATIDEFSATDRKYCELSDEIQLGVFKHEDGSFYAVEIWCSHQRVSLMNGDLEDHELMCPLHGACFDIRNGKHLSLPAVKPIAAYAIKVEGEQIFVDPEIILDPNK